MQEPRSAFVFFMAGRSVTNFIIHDTSHNKHGQNYLKLLKIKQIKFKFVAQYDLGGVMVKLAKSALKDVAANSTQ
jgi:hypothetical protein